MLVLVDALKNIAIAVFLLAAELSINYQKG